MQGSARKDVVFGAARVYTVTVPGPKWKSWLRRIEHLIVALKWSTCKLTLKVRRLLARNRGCLRADPNPIRQAGRWGCGVTTLRWTCTGATDVELRVDTPDGECVKRGGPREHMTTGPWVRDGTLFYLQDVTAGGSPTSSHTLDIIRIRVVPAKCYIHSPLDLVLRSFARRVVRVFSRSSGARSANHL